MTISQFGQWPPSGGQQRVDPLGDIRRNEHLPTVKRGDARQLSANGSCVYPTSSATEPITLVGRYGKRSAVSLPDMPERTKIVCIPASSPEHTSVSIRSPIIRVFAERVPRA